MSGGTDDVREWVNLRGLFIVVSTVGAAYEEKFAETSLRFSEHVTQTIRNVVVKCRWSSMVTVTFAMTHSKQFLANDRMIVVMTLAALFERLSNSTSTKLHLFDYTTPLNAFSLHISMQLTVINKSLQSRVVSAIKNWQRTSDRVCRFPPRSRELSAANEAQKVRCSHGEK